MNPDIETSCRKQERFSENVDDFLSLVCKIESDIFEGKGGKEERGNFDILKDGHHCLTISKTGWPHVAKILKEDDERNLVLKRHRSALESLQGMIAEFRVFRKNGKSIVVQEKLPFILDQKLEALVCGGFLEKAKELTEEYVEFNVNLWRKGMFDWHFRIDHVGLNGFEKIVLFDIGGVRGRPTVKDRIRWRLGYFGRKHKKNVEILSRLHPSLADVYRSSSRKIMTRKVAEQEILRFYRNAPV